MYENWKRVMAANRFGPDRWVSSRCSWMVSGDPDVSRPLGDRKTGSFSILESNISPNRGAAPDWNLYILCDVPTGSTNAWSERSETGR